MSKSFWLLPVLVLVGCSTSPCADFLDHFWPAKPPATGAGAYGGVCPTPPGGGPGVGTPAAPPPLTPTTVPAGNAPVVGPPVTTTPPPANTPYIPGASSPPPPLTTLPAPDLSGTPTNTQPAPGGVEARPLPAPPSGNAPPF